MVVAYERYQVTLLRSDSYLNTPEYYILHTYGCTVFDSYGRCLRAARNRIISRCLRAVVRRHKILNYEAKNISRKGLLSGSGALLDCSLSNFTPRWDNSEGSQQSNEPIISVKRACYMQTSVPYSTFRQLWPQLRLLRLRLRLRSSPFGTPELSHSIRRQRPQPPNTMEQPILEDSTTLKQSNSIKFSLRVFSTAKMTTLPWWNISGWNTGGVYRPKGC